MFGNFLPSFIAATANLGQGDNTVTDWKSGIWNLGVVLAAILVPFLISKFFSNKLRMQSHVGAFFWMFLSLTTTLFILGMWFAGEKNYQLKYGPDIVGGTSFIYEIDRASMGKTTGPKIAAKDFLVPLNNRLNPSGTKEYVIRPIGDDQIEIIIPAVDENEIADIKRIITEAGILQFRIVANPNDHADIIAQATAQANDPDQNARLNRDVYLTDKTTGERRVAGIWRTLGRGVEKDGVRQITGYSNGDLIRNSITGKLINPVLTGKPNDFERWLESQGIKDADILLALERSGVPFVEVNGSDLTRAAKSSSRGGFEVSFTMSVGGATKMLALTGANPPSPTSDFKRRMAILLDGRILSAPSLNSPIRGEGVIEGRFSEAEVDFLVSILNAGALPGAITKQPISENSVGANMGADAISKAFVASAVSLLVTIVCVLVYYRFSGTIATIALLLNLGMILAVMILIKQPLTLSGIAGLVLSVGMSVDANVLVFERIREEIERKATPRMAIRNGFDRAWTTIFDSNLTTLITAIVLYFVGTETIKGFAITLIIGLVISMFTAVFVTHKLFEIAERLKWTWLGMADYVNAGKRALFGEGDINFMKYRFICYTGSLALILAGLAATAWRGSQILDIDFNGGSSIVFSLDKGLSPDEVRAITNKAFAVDEQGLPIQTTLTSVDVKGFDKDTVFKLDVSLKDKDDVTRRLMDGFASSNSKLITFDLEYAVEGGAKSGWYLTKPQTRLVSFQEPTAQDPSSQPPVEPTPPADAKPSDTPPPSNPTEPPKSEPGSAEVKPSDDIQQLGTSNPAPTVPAQAQPTQAKEAPGADEAVATATPSVKTSLELRLRTSVGTGEAKINATQLSQDLIDAAKAIGKTLVDPQIELIPKDASGWTRESGLGFSAWTVTLPFDATTTNQIAEKLRQELRAKPVFQSVSKIESRVAQEMQRRAISGLLLSMIFVVVYIWFRFQRLAYGIAAVIALVHDVLIMLALLAFSHWLFKPLSFLLIEDFKFSLTTVAAFLTIMGYSLNDTIVVFDRIREVKGKSPNLTEVMINASVTQTLSRTLLTSSTTIIAILLMYIFGGEAIHGFAFCLFVGIVVGTYSSIFIAAPILLWFVQREQAAKAAAKVNAR